MRVGWVKMWLSTTISSDLGNGVRYGHSYIPSRFERFPSVRIIRNMFIVLISILATCKWLLALFCLLNLIWFDEVVYVYSAKRRRYNDLEWLEPKPPPIFKTFWSFFMFGMGEARVVRWEKYCDHHACPYVVSHISETTVQISPNILNMLPVVTARSCSDGKSNTLCTSGIVNDVLFSHIRANGPKSCSMFCRVLPGGGTGAKSAVFDCICIYNCWEIIGSYERVLHLASYVVTFKVCLTNFFSIM